MTDAPRSVEECIEFIQSVSFQDLWNGRARHNFSEVVRHLKAVSPDTALRQAVLESGHTEILQRAEEIHKANNTNE